MKFCPSITTAGVSEWASGMGTPTVQGDAVGLATGDAALC
jgi:hypothetical protein